MFFMWTLNAMNFHFGIDFKVSQRFDYIVYSFLLNFRKSVISFFLDPGAVDLSLVHFHEFVGFLQLVFFLNSNFMSY